MFGAGLRSPSGSVSEGWPGLSRSLRRLGHFSRRRTKIPALSLQKPERPAQAALVSKIRKKARASPPMPENCWCLKLPTHCHPERSRGTLRFSPAVIQNGEHRFAADGVPQPFAFFAKAGAFQPSENKIPALSLQKPER